MDLQLPVAGLDRYKSASQRARVVTEPWAQENLYCPACDSPQINSLPTGAHAADFVCRTCKSRFQLKSSTKYFGHRITDGAYVAMQRALMTDNTPNLFLLQYQLSAYKVENVILIPHFAFSMSCLEKRKPLSATARRAGWIGCNFLLDRIPQDAKIPVVESGKVVSPAEVRKAYKKVRPLEKLTLDKRGWTLDVLNIVRSLDKKEFLLSDVYAYTKQLAELHPQNSHIQPKIRQQLQILRDIGLVEFLGAGSYRTP